jgi:hypothetical protein
VRIGERRAGEARPTEANRTPRSATCLTAHLAATNIAGVYARRSPKPLSKLVSIAMAATVFITAQPAFADGSLTKEEIAKAEATALDAKFKFKAGKFEAAAPLFLQAFTLSRKPALLYNAARAYEEAGRPLEAKVAFEQYLGLPHVTAAGRKDAKQRIAALTAKVAGEKQRQMQATKNAAAAKAKAEAEAKRAAAKKEASDQKDALEQARKRDAVVATPTPPKAPIAPSRNRYVTYGVSAGAGLMLLIAVGGQLQAVQVMSDANGMNFSVDNKFIETERQTKKAQYSAKVADAQNRQGSAILSAVIGLGLGGWAAYRLLTPNDGEPKTSVASGPVGDRAASSSRALTVQPLFEINERSQPLFGIRGQF